MTAVHLIAQWVLILVAGGLVFAVLYAALCLVRAGEGAPGAAQSTVRVRQVRCRDGVVRHYTLLRAESAADELYIG
jgi:hypothetical protein